jgi:DNA-binding transcriptional regulator/RsmH inhibitor MraZ
MGIDAQGRISLPNAVRPQAPTGESCSSVLVTLDNKGDILIFETNQSLRGYVEAFAACLGMDKLLVDEFMRRKTLPAKLDSRNRFVIPPHFLSKAGLRPCGEASLMVMDGYFRLESPERAEGRYRELKTLIDEHDPLNKIKVAQANGGGAQSKADVRS